MGVARRESQSQKVVRVAAGQNPSDVQHADRLGELRQLVPSLRSLVQLATRALDDGRIPILVELDGVALPAIPMLGPDCEVAFGRAAGPFVPRSTNHSSRARSR